MEFRGRNSLKLFVKQQERYEPENPKVGIKSENATLIHEHNRTGIFGAKEESFIQYTPTEGSRGRKSDF